MQRLSGLVRAMGMALALSALAAGAQAQSIGFRSPYLGAAVGDTDLGTGFRFFGGGELTNIFGLEGQVTSYGSESHRDGFYTYERSAWAVGAYGTARMAVLPTLSVFAKAGPHYFRFKHTGPGGSTSDSSVELGLGVGLAWQFVPQAALRADFENIGGSGGDVISIGAQFRF